MMRAPTPRRADAQIDLHATAKLAARSILCPVSPCPFRRKCSKINRSGSWRPWRGSRICRSPKWRPSSNTNGLSWRSERASRRSSTYLRSARSRKRCAGETPTGEQCHSNLHVRTPPESERRGKHSRPVMRLCLAGLRHGKPGAGGTRQRAPCRRARRPDRCRRGRGEPRCSSTDGNAGAEAARDRRRDRVDASPRLRTHPDSRRRATIQRAGRGSGGMRHPSWIRPAAAVQAATARWSAPREPLRAPRRASSQQSHSGA